MDVNLEATEAAIQAAQQGTSTGSSADLEAIEMAMQMSGASEPVTEPVNEEATEEAVQDAPEETSEETTEETQEEEVEEVTKLVTEQEEITEEDDFVILDEEETAQVDEFVSQYKEKLTELGFEDVKTKDDLLTKVSELKQKADQVETVFADNLLKEANDIAKKGGDYLAYMQVSSVDYDAIDDNTLLDYSLRADFPDAEERQQYIDDMTDLHKKREVGRIRTQLKTEQEQTKANLSKEAERYQQEFDNNVRAAIKKVDAVEKVKVNDNLKAKIEKSLTTFDEKAKATEFQKKYFLNPDGTPNFEKMAQSAIKLELFDKVVEYSKRSGNAEGKKQIVQKISNVVDPKQKNGAPITTPRKALSFIEQEMERLKAGEKPRV